MIPPWNKGLTKETDDRIANYGKKISNTLSGITYIEKYGEKKAKEKKLNLSIKLKGRHVSLNTRKKLSNALKGRTFSKKHKEKIKITKKERKLKGKYIESFKKISKWHKGKKHSEKTKKKMHSAHIGISHPWAIGKIPWNKGLTKENIKVKDYTEKAKITKSSKKWKDTVGKNAIKKMKKLMDSTKWKNTVGKMRTLKMKNHPTRAKKISEARKGIKFSEETKEKIRQNRLKQIFPTKDTSIEVKVQQFLNKQKIIYEKHKVMLNKFQVDIFIKPNLVIECDGDYWHNRPNAQEKDNKRNLLLKENSYRVVRFWENDINNNFDFVKNKILEELNEIRYMG